MTQRVLSFKKKTKLLSVMNIDSKLLNNHSVHPPLSSGGGGGVIEPPTKFSKKRGGGLTGPQLLEEICWERGSNFIQGVAVFT